MQPILCTFSRISRCNSRVYPRLRCRLDDCQGIRGGPKMKGGVSGILPGEGRSIDFGKNRYILETPASIRLTPAISSCQASLVSLKLCRYLTNAAQKLKCNDILRVDKEVLSFCWERPCDGKHPKPMETLAVLSHGVKGSHFLAALALPLDFFESQTSPRSQGTSSHDAECRVCSTSTRPIRWLRHHGRKTAVQKLQRHPGPWQSE